MKLPLYNQKAEKVGQIDLVDQVFNLEMNKDLLHQVVTSQIANQRQTIGGKKPWRQKGTGRARHGSIRSPIWKGGGVTGGPTKERIFKKKINKKMAKKALFTALSAKARDGQIIVLDDIKLENRKTREMAAVTRAVLNLFVEKKNQSMMIVVPSDSKNDIKIASRNIPRTDVYEARNLNAAAVLGSRYLLMTKDSLTYFSK